jgi:hypothetical protein
MSYWRILLIGALVLGGIAYYQAYLKQQARQHQSPRAPKMERANLNVSRPLQRTVLVVSWASIRPIIGASQFRQADA